MMRTLQSVAVVGAAALLWGCGSDNGDLGTSSEPSESIASVEDGLGEFDGRDALLAALGSLTLDCLGTVGKLTYVIDPKTGALARNFEKCAIGKDPDGTLKRIDGILGVANSKQGQEDGLGKYYAETWGKFQQQFPKDITVCPTWQKAKVINPPTFENVKAHIGLVGKEGYAYKVTEDKQCQGNSECVVAHAMACAGGFGSQFLVKGDPKNSAVTVDPAWWLTHYEFADDASNPFKQPGYYHAMSYYGSPPGSLYGAVERVNELCSQYHAPSGKHYPDRVLTLIDCTDGDGWYCMTYCMEGPYTSPAAPAY